MQKRILYLSALAVTSPCATADSLTLPAAQLLQAKLAHEQSERVDWIRFAGPTDIENFDLEKSALRSKKNRASAARSRDNMKQFRDALLQELASRRVACPYERIAHAEYSPPRDNESAASYRRRCGRVLSKNSRENKQRALQGMISAFRSLDSNERDTIIEKFKAQEMPHLDLLCPTLLSVLKKNRVEKLPDSVYDNLFFNTLGEQLRMSGFAFSQDDTTTIRKHVAMITAYHQLTTAEKFGIIGALKTAGILQPERRLRVTPEELLKRQRRKDATRKASKLRRMQELKTQNTLSSET